MIINIIPCVVVTSLETDAFMAIVACFDMLTVTEAQREFEKKKEGAQGASCCSEKKKRARLCISRLRSNEFFSTECCRIGIERFGGTHQKILRMHLVQN